MSIPRGVLPTAVALASLFAFPGAASAADRDHDRLPDRWEQTHRLSTSADSTAGDVDNDGLKNLTEFRAGTNPRTRDSDRDQVRDGREDSDRDGMDNAAEEATGHDPRDRDTDHDGVRDGRETAGVVLSFKGGKLTIALPGGGRVSALVDDETEIACDPKGPSEDTYRVARRDDEPVAAASKAAKKDSAETEADDAPGDEDENDSDEGEDEGDYEPEGADVEEDGDEPDEDTVDCTPDDLVKGTPVYEADIERTAHGPRVVEMELFGQ